MRRRIAWTLLLSVGLITFWGCKRSTEQSGRIVTNRVIPHGTRRSVN